MKICYCIEKMREEIFNYHIKQQKIALVPTMGNLHDGHLQLIEKAHTIAEKVVVSVFVNPLQFGPNEDFHTYPRTVEADIDKLKAKKVDCVFLPTTALLYPDKETSLTRVFVKSLSEDLCGVSRPQFFEGITTIITKLFHIIQPHVAIFGEKDYQQLIIIKQLVDDLNFPIEIASIPIVREPDGLAMSSRNQYLTLAQRQLAAKLYATLKTMQNQLHETRDFNSLLQIAMDQLTNLGFKVDYLTIRRQSDLQALTADDQNAIILAACYLGKTRLIDNLKCYLTHCNN